MNRTALTFARRCLCAAVLLGAATLAAQAQSIASRHAPVSAHAAQQAISHGATVLDVRDAASYIQAALPGAVLVANAAQLSDAQLAQAVSAAGVDLSRTVLLVGEPGSASAQALHARLAQVASGQVLWLVGGLQEWQAIGAAAPAGQAQTQRYAVPQHLVSLPATAPLESPATLPTSSITAQATSAAAGLYGFARLY
jgi:rhodanese-related sulfurtransferase